MNSQLKLLQEETESKREIREAIRVIDLLTEGIAKIDTSKYDWGDFGGISYLRLLEILHDSGRNSITWNVKIKSVFDCKLDAFPNFDSFRKVFEKTMHNNWDARIVFSSSPKIEASPNVEVDDIDIKDYSTDIYNILMVHENLKRIERIVNLFDRYLTSEVLDIYIKMLKTFYVAITDEIKLTISSEIKTEKLPYYLLNIIAFDIWQECVSNLKGNIIPRLYEVKRHMLESL